MKIDAALDLARQDRLYPGVILHGGSQEHRVEAAVLLARTLLCEVELGVRPCGECRHCRRILAPGGDRNLFHPDFVVLERDLRTSTSAEATRQMLRTVQVSPFEARGQVFLVVSAESLTGGAANALLKSLEEPPISAPRHFILLSPSSVDLLPTLRSRCLSIYVGGEEGASDRDGVDKLAAEIAALLEGYRASGSASYLQNVATAMAAAGGFDEVRSTEGFSRASGALLELCRAEPSVGVVYVGPKAPLLDLAEELLIAIDMRVRGIQPQRILEGLVSKHLVALRR